MQTLPLKDVDFYESARSFAIDLTNPMWITSK